MPSPLQIFNPGRILAPPLELAFRETRVLLCRHEADVPREVQMMISVEKLNLKLFFFQIACQRSTMKPLKLFDRFREVTRNHAPVQTFSFCTHDRCDESRL